MAIPVSHVAETIVAFAKQMKQALCDAKDAGIVLELDEEFKFRLSVISPNGLGALSRTTTQNTGEQVQTVENPDRVETQVVGEGLTTTTASASETVNTQVQKAPIKTTRKYDDPVTFTTKRSGTPESTTSTQTQDTDGTTKQSADGGNLATELIYYETL